MSKIQAENLIDPRLFYSGMDGRYRRIVEGVLSFKRSYTNPSDCNTVIDIGCGMGEVLFLLQVEGFTAKGCDADIDRVRKCQNKQLHVVHGDSSTLPFSTNLADCVVCSEVLEHVKSLNNTVEEIYRVLKPGGCLIVTVPAPGETPERLRKLKHVREFTPEDLMVLFSEKFIVKTVDFIFKTPETLKANRPNTYVELISLKENM